MYSYSRDIRWALFNYINNYNPFRYWIWYPACRFQRSSAQSRWRSDEATSRCMEICERSDSVTLSSSTVGARSPRILRYQGIELVYESRQNNILTKESLKHIADFEWQLRNNTAWREKICLLDSKKECQKPNSILRFFDGTYRGVHEGLFDPDFENITKVLGIAQSLNKTRLILAYPPRKGRHRRSRHSKDSSLQVH